MARGKKERRKINRDKVRGAAKDRKQGGGGLTTLDLPEGMEFFQFNAGKNVLDILPYEVKVSNHPQVGKGDLWYERTFWLHRDVGPEEKVFICPQKTAGEACPICEEHSRLKKDPQADEDLVDALRPKKRQLFNVLDKGPKGSGDIQLLEMSYHLFGKKLDTELSEDDGGEIAGFADLEGGLTLKVRMNNESAGQYKFLDADRIDFEERKKDYEDDILDEVVDLDKCLKIESYEKLDAEFNGTTSEESTGDNKQEDPPDEKEEKEEEPADDRPDDAVDCVACEGEGKNSRGRPCRACDGKGWKVPEEEEEPSKEEDKKEDPPEEPAKEEEKEEEPKKGADDKEEDGWGDDDW